LPSSIRTSTSASMRSRRHIGQSRSCTSSTGGARTGCCSVPATRWSTRNGREVENPRIVQKTLPQEQRDKAVGSQPVGRRGTGPGSRRMSRLTMEASKMRDLLDRSALRYKSAFLFVTACRCFIVSSLETGTTHIRHRSCATTSRRRFSSEATRLTHRFDQPPVRRLPGHGQHPTRHRDGNTAFG